MSAEEEEPAPVIRCVRCPDQPRVWIVPPHCFEVFGEYWCPIGKHETNRWGIPLKLKASS